MKFITKKACLTTLTGVAAMLMPCALHAQAQTTSLDKLLPLCRSARKRSF